jgi:hypothetical protein
MLIIKKNSQQNVQIHETKILTNMMSKLGYASQMIPPHNLSPPQKYC